MAILLAQLRAHQLAGRTSAHGGALVRRLDLHIAAEERALDEIVGAALIRQHRRQLGMNRGAVKTLGVILEHQLPVRRHVVAHAMSHDQAGHAEPNQATDHRGPHVRERLRRACHVDEQEPFPFLDRGGMERIVRFVEALGLLHVRRSEQASIGGVRPGVIGALDGLAELPRVFAAEPRAAMAAHVEEGAQRAGAIAQDDDRLVGDRTRHVIAGGSERRGAPDAIPAAGVDALQLLGQDLRRDVVLARQRARALNEGSGGAPELTHERRSPSIRRAASQPAPPSTPGPGWHPAPPR